MLFARAALDEDSAPITDSYCQRTGSCFPDTVYLSSIARTEAIMQLTAFEFVVAIGSVAAVLYYAVRRRPGEAISTMASWFLGLLAVGALTWSTNALTTRS